MAKQIKTRTPIAKTKPARSAGLSGDSVVGSFPTVGAGGQRSAGIDDGRFELASQAPMPTAEISPGVPFSNARSGVPETATLLQILGPDHPAIEIRRLTADDLTVVPSNDPEAQAAAEWAAENWRLFVER